MKFLISAACDGLITSEQLQELEALVCESELAARVYAEYCALHVELHFNAIGKRIHQEVGQQITEQASSSDRLISPVELSSSVQLSHSLGKQTSWTSMAVGCAVGILCTVLVYSTTQNTDNNLPLNAQNFTVPILPDDGPQDNDGPQENGEFVARLVSRTGTVWNASVREPLESGDQLRFQETVTIQEGVATFELVSGLTIDLEGPAVVSVDLDGMPVVQYGKVVASLPWGAQPIVVKASLGEVQLDGNDIAGIGVFGSSLQIYVFRGQVSVEARSPEEESLLLSSGEGRSLSISSSGERYSLSTRPKKEMFASWNSITSDLLRVTDAYVASVRKSQPVGYWRFEEVVEGEILNEVSDKHHGLLGGKARLVDQEPNGPKVNHVAEFGFGLESGYLFVEEPFDELAGSDYAFELWVKPNHFHRSTIVGLVERRSHIQETEGTAFLLETLDDQSRRKRREHSLRFLHRSPPSPDLGVGKSCYSSQSYEPRKWQYLVAVKQGHKMRLFVNGRVLASCEDRTDLVSGLNLVVGQLRSFEPVRPFVGQIDELAVYDHALSSQEIKSRYHLLR